MTTLWTGQRKGVDLSHDFLIVPFLCFSFSSLLTFLQVWWDWIKDDTIFKGFRLQCEERYCIIGVLKDLLELFCLMVLYRTHHFNKSSQEKSYLLFQRDKVNKPCNFPSPGKVLKFFVMWESVCLLLQKEPWFT